MTVRCSIEDAVATVTIDRPQTKNALTQDMRGQMASIFGQLQDDDTVRAIVLTGAGQDFCSGGDTSGIGGSDIPTSMGRIRYLHRMIRAIAATNRPTIAAVSGVSIGLGWSLALACDFVIAATDARFQFAFRHVGLAPDGGAPWLLSRYVGLMRAKELIYSGRMVSGSEAVTLGLALEALPKEQVLSRALGLAREYSQAAPLSLVMAKRQFDAASNQTFEQALAFEANIQPLMSRTEDSAEGIAALREKRKPIFRGL